MKYSLNPDVANTADHLIPASPKISFTMSAIYICGKERNDRADNSKERLKMVLMPWLPLPNRPEPQNRARKADYDQKLNCRLSRIRVLHFTSELC